VRLALVTPLMHHDVLAAAALATRIDTAGRRVLRAAADAIIPAEGRMPAASGVDRQCLKRAIEIGKGRSILRPDRHRSIEVTPLA
jgi:hypothetical protein